MSLSDNQKSFRIRRILNPIQLTTVCFWLRAKEEKLRNKKRLDDDFTVVKCLLSVYEDIY